MNSYTRLQTEIFTRSVDERCTHDDASWSSSSPRHHFSPIRCHTSASTSCVQHSVRGRGPHQVLVSLRIDILGDQSPVGGAVGVLIRRQGVGAQLSGQLDLVLDGPILHREVHCSAHSTDRVLHEGTSCALVTTAYFQVWEGVAAPMETPAVMHLP